MVEKWKKIQNYEKYEISNFGRCKSLPKKTRNRFGEYTTKEKILKPRKRNHGYLCYALYDENGNRKTFSAHRLVADAFIPNQDKKSETNHKNGIKTDNRAENLEWVTHSENCKHAVETGLHIPVGLKGEKHANSKHTENDILNIRNIAKNTDLYYREIGEIFGISRRYVGEIVNRKVWTHI